MNLPPSLEQSFIHSLVFISQLAVNCHDSFFSKKLFGQLEKYILSYLQFMRQQDSAKRKEFLAILYILLDILEDIKHLKLAALGPVLKTQKSLLQVKLKLLRLPKIPEKEEGSSQEKIPLNKLSFLSPSEQKILSFVRRSQHARARDIIDELGSLSERTVKRSIKGLLNSGLLSKHQEDKAVYYTTLLKS